jgi:hypothetical protein
MDIFAIGKLCARTQVRLIRSAETAVGSHRGHATISNCHFRRSLKRLSAQLILQDIKGRLANNHAAGKTIDKYSVAICNPGSFSLNVTVKPKIAYVHTGRSSISPDIQARIQSSVQSYGVKVGGFDPDVDPAGGVGVDYFDDSDRSLAQQMADSIGNVIGRGQFPPRKQSSKLNQQGVFGVWLPPLS